jgi:hypothetical protein
MVYTMSMFSYTMKVQGKCMDNEGRILNNIENSKRREEFLLHKAQKLNKKQLDH